jgi:hypothetical protein
LPVGPTPPPLNAEIHGRIKGVVTVRAFPSVTHAVNVGVFGRFRQIEPFATFDAAHERDGGSGLHGLSVGLEHELTRARATCSTLGIGELKCACSKWSNLSLSRQILRESSIVAGFSRHRDTQFTTW